MRIDPKNPKWEDRDRFVLSKGHTAPGLYAALAERGFFPTEDLKTFRHIDSYLQGHPDMKGVPGVDMSSGSLGLGVSTACGMALSGKVYNKDYRVYTVLGDGEIAEGQVWEAAMFAAHYKLDNLTVFLDFNGLQIDGKVTEVMNPTPHDTKFEAFGWNVITINGHSFEEIESAVNAAKAFGSFQMALADIGEPRLNDTIPDFHNTPKRLAALREAVKADVMGRKAGVAAEIDFVESRADICSKLTDLLARGVLPERITHNDTKANNILIDDVTGEAVCVIDLDTVMPGLALYDFGDMVRSGTNPAEEDEVDLNKVGMRFDMYQGFYEGFIDTAGKFLTPAEHEYLPFSGKLITLEIGTRFLTDYLAGDIYFKTRRPNQNLDLCRTQFKLVESMEAQMNHMKDLLLK
jgi:transketolase N-terminal domain/subunit